MPRSSTKNKSERTSRATSGRKAGASPEVEPSFKVNSTPKAEPSPKVKPGRKVKPTSNAKAGRKVKPTAKAEQSLKAKPSARPEASSGAKSARTRAAARPSHDVSAVLRDLQRNASKRFKADMTARYGIVTELSVFGTPMAKIKALAKSLGRDHDFAQTLWQTGVYEARLLASMVDEPERVTAAQMDRWAKDCDNWALVDTLCFHLFDRTPHAFTKAAKWSTANGEFVKRAGFALVACLALHGRGAEEDFLELMPHIERAATDERNFVKKAVSWALRAIGSKRAPKLRAAARTLAQRLAESEHRSARWIGRDALRAFAKADSKPVPRQAPTA